MNSTGPAKPAPAVWTVSRLNGVVVEALANDSRLQNVWVRGEVSNFHHHDSGHMYFTLKDGRAQVGCTFFRGANARHRGPTPREGDDVIVRGRPSLYGARGSYQFNVQELRPAGVGDIRQRIEELRRRLHAEGLFAPARRRTLPQYPMTIGVATAPGGAAVQDIIRVARARFALVNILIAPCRVQGSDAIGSIVEAIATLNEPALRVDVIIAGRGGGSFEDLLAFNEEAVVRAFAASRVPIISAVGHEIDTVLTDLAADAAAPTPSAAAERAIPEMEAVLAEIDDYALRLKVSLRNRRHNEHDRLTRLFSARVYQEPYSMLENRQQSVDVLSRELRAQLRDRLHRAHRALQRSTGMSARFAALLEQRRSRFALLAERLSNFSPLATLRRGYALVRDAGGRIVRDAAGVKQGDPLQVRLAQGALEVSVLRALPEADTARGPQ